MEGAGRRRVSFSWGCNRYCALQTVVTDKHTLLLDEEDGTMHYGVIERVVDGPEAFMLITDSEENDAELVLDTLSISVLPEQ